MSGYKKAMLISEVGWRGLRELSLELLKNGLAVDIIIKGTVKKEVLEVITKPDGLRICAISKWLFNVYLFCYLLQHKMSGDLERIVVTKERTKNWIKGLGLDAKVLVEMDRGYDLR